MWLGDLRHALRGLLRSPGFTVTAIVTVALGIGVATAIFSVIHSVALQPLPFGEPERLVAVWTHAPATGDRRPVGIANYTDWRAQNTVFEEIGLARPLGNFNLTGEGDPERVSGAYATAGLFTTLAVRPALGRTFVEQEEANGQPNVVVLSDRLWKRRFGADPGVIGRNIVLNGTPHEVVGVMGPGFRYPGSEFQLWLPLRVNPADFRTRQNWAFLAVARLKPGVGVREAQAEMDVISQRLAAQFPQSNTDVGALVAPLRADMVSALRDGLYLLFGAVVCLVLIGGANLTNLSLARILSRSKDRTIRAALGATPGRLVLYSFAELAPIVCAGGLAGTLLAMWAVQAVLPLLPASLPRIDEIRVGAPVFAFAAAVSLLLGATAVVLSLLGVGHRDLAATLADSSRGATEGRRSTSLRDVIVAAQIAIAVLLVFGAGLLVRSYSEVTKVDPGFEPADVLTMHLAVPRSKYTSDESIATFYTAILDRVGGLPGVDSVGMVNRLPLAGGAQTGSIQVEGFVSLPESLRIVDWRVATPDYFRTIGIPLKRGRAFSGTDTATATPVGIIDERVADALWPGEDPLGKRFRLPPGAAGGNTPWVEIVGVVGHVRHDGLDEDTRPQVYWSYLQFTQDRSVLVVKSPSDPQALAASVIAEIRAIDPEQPVYDVRPLSEVVWLSISQQWLGATLVSVFASLALCLTSVGIYGVMSYSVSERARELALRVALGARREDVVRVVLVRAARLTIAGVFAGVVASWLLAQLMAGLVFNVGTRDIASFAAAIGIIAGVAFLASYVPARRAAAADPVSTLR